MTTKILHSIILVLISFVSFGQKNILLTKYPQEVPKGKKWILATDQETLVEVSYGVLNTGSLCNALFLSSPGVISGVSEGQYGNPNQSYTILFNTLNKVAYTNEYTFSIVPKAIVTSEFSLSELQTKQVDQVGEDQIAFLSGEKVYVGNCLTSLQVIEVDMSKADLQAVAKRQQVKEQQRAETDAKLNYIKQNEFKEFSIPVNAEKYVSSGTTPVNQDEKLYQIKFKSSGVLFKDKKDKKFSLDESSWAILLTNNYFKIESDRNYEKDFKVISYKYDEKMSSSKFELSNDSENITHILYISWFQSRKEYSLLFKSLDSVEEFQFQEVKAIEKNGKTIESYPKVVIIKNVSEDFFIKKKKNSTIKAYWVNENKKIVNYSAHIRDHRAEISFTDIHELKISPELIKEIENNLTDKESGNYFIGFNVEETNIEIQKGVFETKRKISLNQFYSGTYDNPNEIYKR